MAKKVKTPKFPGRNKIIEGWDKYVANRNWDKNAVYEYLEAVFDLVQSWDKEGQADEYSLRALKQLSKPIKLADPYARMIYRTSEGIDGQTRWKWATCMQCVAKMKEESESFTEYVQRIGGLNKCAELATWAKRP